MVLVIIVVSYVLSLRFYEYALSVLSIGVLIHGLLLYVDSVAVFIMVFTVVLSVASSYMVSLRYDIGLVIVRSTLVIWVHMVSQQLSMRTTSFRACLLIFLF